MPQQNVDLPVLTINGGSSSIKFALYTPRNPPQRLLSGEIERIGLTDTNLSVTNDVSAQDERRPVQAADHAQAAGQLIGWLEERLGPDALGAVGHRIVHGGVNVTGHQLVTDELVDELRKSLPQNLAHLPRQLALVEAFRGHFPALPQVACFDTVFHRDLPRVARLLPIPRQYDRAGVRRLGFHGLSYAYLMRELRRVAGDRAADGRVILAHLGSGASMAAVRDAKPVDTTMCFTPTAGLVMGTRPGDMDPGLLVYLMRTEGLSAEQMEDFITRRCGLIGVSETSSDMRDLIARRGEDPRAAEAVELFCYQARKWVGALAAAMGGLDTLIFSGGIGEHSPEVRREICQGLEFLGLRLDAAHNDSGAAVISSDDSSVTGRVIATDEELMIATIVLQILNQTESS